MTRLQGWFVIGLLVLLVALVLWPTHARPHRPRFVVFGSNIYDRQTLASCTLDGWGWDNERKQSVRVARCPGWDWRDAMDPRFERQNDADKIADAVEKIADALDRLRP